MLRREPSRGFRVGTKTGFSWPNPSRPPSPLPHIHRFPSTSNDEWNSPQEIPTSTGISAAFFGEGGTGCAEGRRPGIDEDNRKERGSDRDATGAGHIRISSMPPPNCPEAPRPQDNSLTVTSCSESMPSDFQRRGSFDDTSLTVEMVPVAAGTVAVDCSLHECRVNSVK
nr:hypothetical protein Iba_chr14aCG22830 [Ipomoea batatas]